MLTGYLHPDYAESLTEFGTPLALPHCGGWILARQIPGYDFRDAMGCYPLFACQDWSQIHRDLDEARHELVSLALVTDPFGEYDEGGLRRCFELVIPFKEHFITDLDRPIDEVVSKHHRRNVQKAFRDLCVERCEEPSRFLPEWSSLYATLIERHHIKGIAAFSELSFAKQLEIPGLVMLRALYHGITVGMTLWYMQGNVCYYHLGAYSDIGYRLHASFALFSSAIEHFADKDELRWLNLGAGPGIEGGSLDGLSRFKRGWSTGTRTAYLCGRIFDHAAYSMITKKQGIPASDYFPAYRKGEFA
jgi:hypothetical protein